MPVTARSTPNIALIKYWGNRNNAMRMPAADSISMTLDSPALEITICHADQLTVRSFDERGHEKTLIEKTISRFSQHLELTKAYLKKLGMPEAIPSSMSITIRSAIPPAIGLASSAAAFSALAKAIGGLIREQLKLSDKQLSVIARLGSGSAARSIYGGYAALLSGDGEELDASSAMQIASENHWLLHDIILVPSKEEKKVGSTEGHHAAWTSSLFNERLHQMPRRNQECRDAILQRDFEKLQKIAEEDALEMHRVMASQVPPLKYLSEDTHRIIGEITALRNSEKLSVLYTMDAGPTAHLICTDDAAKTVREFAAAQRGCKVFETSVGGGARLL